NELGLSISYQDIYDLLGPNNSVNYYWDVFVTDLYDTTGTNNGPYFLQLASDSEGGLNQPPTAFNLESPSDYSLFYVNPNNLDNTGLLQWEESLDPDGNNITYYYIYSHSPNMSESIGNPWEFQENSVFVSGEGVYDYLIDNNLTEQVYYWDIIASDGLFEQNSSNGPFMAYWVLGENPAENEETYADLFISDWYIGYRSSPTYNAAVELYNPKEEPIDLSNYILRRTQNGSHWMESSWIRLDGILPPNSTYVLTRAASDLALQNCADLVDPDEFLKHNGDDGFKVTQIGYLPESLSEDTTAWMKMGLTLDAIGYADNDPGSAWDVSGVTEATRYYILSRNMDVCGGNGGDWNASRGCVNASCDSTSSELGEWSPISCALSPSPGDMPEGSDASTDALIFCGNHNYFCSSVSVMDEILPQKVELEQNYPNPFNPKTEISFTMSIQDRAILSIYNIKGQKVATIMDSQMQPGKHTLTWSGKDSMGREVSSGMYFYKLTVGKINYQRKLILLR
ncbi:MAG: lamin tail domain-containing protein, partial [Candidatus Neomarinimicrobiota bacterium]